MKQLAVPCTVMRGGTSKGLFFSGDDLPTDPEVRDALLCAALGSPDPRQIDGLGGGHPLTSKVAIVTRSTRPDVDVDYLFLQVWPDRTEVTDQQNCGNLLAAVGPYAIEHGLVSPTEETTSVRILMRNSDEIAIAHVPTPNGQVNYHGTTRIDGVTGTHAPIAIDFLDLAGATCGALLPTGNAVDQLDGIPATCIDNGMPVVCVAADTLGLTGTESPSTLEADHELVRRIQRIRLAAGSLMNLGDVTSASIPKISLLAAPAHGGTISTRTFIPQRVHDSIGVLGAVSVATACLIPGSVAAHYAEVSPGDSQLEVEHPSGSLTVTLDIEITGEGVRVRRAGLIRTARALMRGEVLIPAEIVNTVGSPT